MQLSIMLHAREAFAAAAAGAAPSAVRQHVLADSQLVTGNWQSPLLAHVYTLPHWEVGVLGANVAYEFIVCHVHRITLS